MHDKELINYLSASVLYEFLLKHRGKQPLQ